MAGRRTAPTVVSHAFTLRPSRSARRGDGTGRCAGDARREPAGRSQAEPAAEAGDLGSTLRQLVDGILAERDVTELTDAGQLTVTVGPDGEVLTSRSGIFDADRRILDGCGPPLAGLLGDLRGDLAGADPISGVGDPALGLDGWPVLRFAGADRSWTVTFGPGGGVVVGIGVGPGTNGIEAMADCTPPG